MSEISSCRFQGFCVGEQVLPTNAARKILNGVNWRTLHVIVHDVKIKPGGRTYFIKIGGNVFPALFWEKNCMFYGLPSD